MDYKPNVTIEEVYDFWNNSYLYSMEINQEEGSKEFFECINRLRCDDIEKFSYKLWQFNNHKSEKVLDIGCGPGWLVRKYAEGCAKVYAVDITDKAVELTKKMLKIFNLEANVQTGNAESLPFEDNSFDFVSSSGVLHHTPNMQKAVDEAYRVLKPGCEAVISIYYKNILFNKYFFPLFLRIYRLFKPSVPGRDNMMNARDSDDFIRMYDGVNNPVGYGLTIEECKRMFSKFEIIAYETHFFPKRFIPFFKNVPDFIYSLLDRYLGTMIFLKLRKNK